MAGEWQKKYGTESRIQLNDQISEVKDIPLFVEEEVSARVEADRPFVTFSIKADKDTKMGLVSDIKQELRNSGAFKIFYNAAHGERK
jgi:biopolymer transport protein ExbD